MTTPALPVPGDPYLEDVLWTLQTAIDAGVLDASTAYAAGRHVVDEVIASIDERDPAGT